MVQPFLQEAKSKLGFMTKLEFACKRRIIELLRRNRHAAYAQHLEKYMLHIVR